MPRKTALDVPPVLRDDLPSMRPRPDAAENHPIMPSGTPERTAFNEAAARCRGKPLGSRPPGGSRRRPSMRPRPDAAENPWRNRHFVGGYGALQ